MNQRVFISVEIWLSDSRLKAFLIYWLFSYENEASLDQSRGQMITSCFWQVSFKVILYSLLDFLAFDHKNQKLQDKLVYFYCRP